MECVEESSYREQHTCKAVTVKVDYWVVTYAYLVYKLLHVDWCQQNGDVALLLSVLSLNTALSIT